MVFVEANKENDNNVYDNFNVFKMHVGLLYFCFATKQCKGQHGFYTDCHCHRFCFAG